MAGEVAVAFRKEFVASRRGLAVPATYLILFGSLIVLVSLTYGFAMGQIRARGAALGLAVAKQNMQALDDAVHFVAWNPGASRTVYMDDCGAVFQALPDAGSLVLRLSSVGFSTVVFNGSVGRALYLFSALPESHEGSFLRGDSRAIVGMGDSAPTRLYFARNGSTHQLVLCYRPMAAALALNMSGGEPHNVIRVYIISLNGTRQPLTLGGGFNLKVSAVNVAFTVYSFNFEGEASLALEAFLDGAETRVWLPVASTLEGTVVNVEVYVCSISLQMAGL